MQQKDEKNAGYTILTAADQKKVWRSKYNPLGSVSDLNEADQHPVILFSMLLPSTPPRMTPSYITTTSSLTTSFWIFACVCDVSSSCEWPRSGRALQPRAVLILVECFLVCVCNMRVCESVCVE